MGNIYPSHRPYMDAVFQDAFDFLGKKNRNSKLSAVATSISTEKTPISLNILEIDGSNYCNPEIQHLILDEVNFNGSDVGCDYGIV